MNLDYRFTYINDQPRLLALSEGLGSVTALALDIETVNWWSRQSERVALVQLAYREGRELRVAVMDALARLDLTPLRRPLELGTATKVIHNAAFDAVRLARHYKISAAPIHDTMLAARRGGERRYSLKAQTEKHLNLRLDKGARQSDWALRPLHPKQLSYAALDAVAALLLVFGCARSGVNFHAVAQFKVFRLAARVVDNQRTLAARFIAGRAAEEFDVQ
jgi:ribonuclease D